MKFYTTTQNSRNSTVSAGSHRGQNTHTRTWTHGVRVQSTIYDTQKNSPIGFSIFATSGSDGQSAEIYIGEVILDKNNRPIFKKAKGFQK